MASISGTRVCSMLLLLAVSFGSASSAAAPSFTTEQASKGRGLYLRHCSTCHGERLQGEQITPALVDARFDRSFRGKSAGVLAFHLRRMPPEPIDSPINCEAIFSRSSEKRLPGCSLRTGRPRRRASLTQSSRSMAPR